MYQCTFPSTVHQGSFSSTSSQHLLFLSFSTVAILTGVMWYLMASDLHLPDDYCCWTPFHVPVGHLDISSGKCPFMSYAHFLIELLFCYWVLWVLHIFWILTLCQIIWFANIFLPFQRLPIYFVDGFLSCAEDFQFEVVQFIFAFVSFAFGTKSKKSSPRLMSRSLPPIFYSRTLKVSGLMFKSLFHFELVFVYGVDSSPVFTTLFIEKTIPSLLYTLGSSVINYWPYMCGFISGLCILLYWSICPFTCQCHTVLITIVL